MICPRCEKGVLEEKEAFCYECGLCGLTLCPAERTKSPPLLRLDVKTASKEPDQTEQDSDVNTSDSTETLHGKSLKSITIKSIIFILEVLGEGKIVPGCRSACFRFLDCMLF